MIDKKVWMIVSWQEDGSAYWLKQMKGTQKEVSDYVRHEVLPHPHPVSICEIINPETRPSHEDSSGPPPPATK